jgi:hypothetical protein
MDRKMDKRKEGRRRRVAVNNTPVEESLLIRQRLRNLCELAIAIGQKKGLLGNHENNHTIDLEGGQNVANKRYIRDCDAAPTGQDKAGSQERGT